MQPVYLAETNPDFVFCLCIFLAFAVLALASARISLRYFNASPLTTPSFFKFSYSWGKQPLQFLFQCTIYVLALFLGSASQSIANPMGFWAMAVHFSALAGLLIGQLLVYSIHTKHIVQS